MVYILYTPIYQSKYVIKWLENNKELPEDNVDIEKD